MMLNNLNILELEDYINEIFDLQSPITDKRVAVMEFELRLDSVLSKFIETETLQHAR